MSDDVTRQDGPMSTDEMRCPRCEHAMSLHTPLWDGQRSCDHEACRCRDAVGEVFW